MKFKNMIILLLLGGCPSATWAQTIIHDTIYIAQPRQKSVVKARMIGIGSSNILDTYLSPEKYSGPEVRYLSHTTYRKTGSRDRKSTRLNSSHANISYAVFCLKK